MGLLSLELRFPRSLFSIPVLSCFTHVVTRFLRSLCQPHAIPTNLRVISLLLYLPASNCRCHFLAVTEFRGDCIIVIGALNPRTQWTLFLRFLQTSDTQCISDMTPPPTNSLPPVSPIPKSAIYHPATYQSQPITHPKQWTKRSLSLLTPHRHRIMKRMPLNVDSRFRAPNPQAGGWKSGSLRHPGKSHEAGKPTTQQS
jgi:hypothetical protein